jgi:hypothetical protein
MDASDDQKNLFIYQQHDQKYSSYVYNGGDNNYYLSKWSDDSKIVLTRTIINKEPAFWESANPFKN